MTYPMDWRGSGTIAKVVRLYTNKRARRALVFARQKEADRQERIRRTPHVFVPDYSGIQRYVCERCGKKWSYAALQQDLSKNYGCPGKTGDAS